jgi:hypothetical protein
LRLQAPGGIALDLQAGAWTRLELEATLGTGTWSLKVSPAGGEVREFKGLALEKPAFKRVTWIGFTSGAVESTSFHLDNVKVTCR